MRFRLELELELHRRARSAAMIDAPASKLLAGDGLIDGGPLVQRLGQIAGVEFPRAVKELIELRIAASRSEREAQLLAAVVMGDEVRRLEGEEQ
jgi:hypothetical protein